MTDQEYGVAVDWARVVFALQAALRSADELWCFVIMLRSEHGGYETFTPNWSAWSRCGGWITLLAFSIRMMRLAVAGDAKCLTNDMALQSKSAPARSSAIPIIGECPLYSPSRPASEHASRVCADSC